MPIQCHNAVARLCLLASLLTACGFGKRPPDPPRHLDVRVSSSFFSSNTGMRVYVIPMADSSLVRLDVRYAVGATSDPDGKHGLAHLVEHMMFESTVTADGKTAASELSRLTHSYNAYTNLDSTHYHMLTAPEHLDATLGVHIKALTLGCTAFDNKTFEREREVVRNEIRSRHASPEGQVPALLYATLYPEGHPYHRTIGLDDVQLAQANRGDVCTFMVKHYVASRATFVFSGDISEATVRRLANKWLTRVPQRRSSPVKIAAPVTVGKRRKVEHELNIEKPLLTVAWPMPPEFSAQGRLGRMAVSRVRWRVANFAHTYKFGFDVTADLVGGAYAPFFLLSVTLHDAGKADEALSMIMKAARDAPRLIARKQFEQEMREYLRVEASQLALSDFESIGDRAIAFADRAQFEPDGGYLKGTLQEASKIDIDHIRKLAGQLMDPDKATVVMFRPRAGASTYSAASLQYSGTQHSDAWKVSVDPAEADRPLPKPRPTSRYKSLKMLRLDNGLRVLLWPNADLPIVRTRLVVHSGGAHEPKARPGIADVAGNAADVGMDHTVFARQTLSSEVDHMLEGVARRVRTPGYGPLDDYRELLKKTLAIKRDVAYREFVGRMESALYGANHPYARRQHLGPEFLGGLTRDGAYSFAKRHYVAKNAALVVSGQFDTARIERYVRWSFSHWGAGEASPPITAEANTQAQLVTGTAEDRAVADVLIWFPGSAGVDKTYAARLVLASMLKGRFRALREESALTYGFSARYQPRSGVGSWRIRGQLDAYRSQEGLGEINKLLADFREGKSLKADFALARRHVLRQLLADTGDARAFTNQLEFIARYGLRLDHFDQLAARVANLRLDDVRKLMSSELGPDKQVFGIFGPQRSMPTANEAQ